MLPLPQSAARTGHFDSVNAAQRLLCARHCVRCWGHGDGTTARPLHPGIPNLYPGTVLCKHILRKKEWILVFTMQEEILSLVSLLLFVEYLVSEKQFGSNIFLRDLSQTIYFLTFNLLLFPKLLGNLTWAALFESFIETWFAC